MDSFNHFVKKKRQICDDEVIYFLVCALQTDKYRRNRDAITQKPELEPAVDQDNSYGYKGTL